MEFAFTSVFFARNSPRARVAAVMRMRYDQFGKQMFRDRFERRWSVVTDAEVPAEARRIDLWATPREPGEPPPEDLGLMGRITSGPVTLEFFHHTPSGEELRMCLIKHGEFRHFLSRRTTLPPLPILYVISSGRPDAGIDGLGFRPMTGQRGFYESPPLQYTRLVVVSELPVTRDTLRMRLLGAGAVLKQAMAELMALPADAPERRSVLPLLLKFRLDVPTDPAQQTSDDKEFLMDTQDAVETWRREAIQEGVKQGLEEGVKQGLEEGVKQGLEEGVKQGLEQGERKLLLRMLRRRFGAEVDGETERRVAMAPAEQIEVWAERVLSATTLAEVLAD
jgi:hypothetical protein